MREKFKSCEGVRAAFTAEFVRFGSKTAYKGPDLVTLLFKDVRNEQGVVMTDHLWFTTCGQWIALDLKPGDKVAFDARVRSYRKGYEGRGEDGYEGYQETDYKLSHPTKARKLGVQALVEALPLFAK